MNKLDNFWEKYKIAIVSIFLIAVYLSLKSVFWPMQKNIIVRIHQQHNEILNLDTPANSRKEIQLVLDRVNFRSGPELFHDNTGYLNYKNNFFMYISTQIKVLKEANYLFRVASDDGFRLKLNNTIVCEHLQGRPFGVTECPYRLKPGRHLLQLDYFQGPDQMGLRLTYQTDKSKEYFVGENSDLMIFQLADGHLSLSDNTSANKIEHLIQQAELDDGYSQFILAKKYLIGDKLKQDNNQAFKWFKEAAKNGDIDAQLYLGKMYLKGIGCQQNVQEALFWLKLSAKNFNGDAQYYLGQLYFNGNGVEQNYTEAFYWIKKAAMGEGEDNQHPFFVTKKSGHTEAQFQLGKMYELGLGVAPNSELAKKWRLKSNRHDNKNSDK